jgi:hypothetical protein
MRKGQSALEYLVTYGWAILAIVIVAAILWYFGVFNPSRFTSSHQCGGFADFQCIDYNASTSAGTASIILGNKLGTQLNVTSVTIGISSNCLTASQLIGANQQASASCTGIGNPQSGNTYNVTVVFTSTQSGLTHTDTGFIGAS